MEDEELVSDSLQQLKTKKPPLLKDRPDKVARSLCTVKMLILTASEIEYAMNDFCCFLHFLSGRNKDGPAKQKGGLITTKYCMNNQNKRIMGKICTRGMSTVLYKFRVLTGKDH